MNYKLVFSAALTLLVLMFVGACEKQESGASLHVRLTDAPGDFQEVNIDLQEVQIHLDEDWVSLPTNAQVYDLLTLQNGIDTTIVNTSGLQDPIYTLSFSNPVGRAQQHQKSQHNLKNDKLQVIARYANRQSLKKNLKLI